MEGKRGHTAKVIPWLSLAISLIALGLSGWIFYYQEIGVRNRLIANVNLLQIPDVEESESIFSEAEGEKGSSTLIRGSIIFSNDGNRPAIVTEIKFLYYLIDKEPSVLSYEDCSGNPSVASLYSDVQSERLPLSVDPSAMESLRFTDSLRVLPSREMLGSDVRICLAITTIDSSGTQQTTELPVARLIFVDRGDKAVLGAMLGPTNPVAVLIE